ncbi:MAG: glycosyltransferase family 4 protein [Vicinamibacteria bacterium]
MGKNKLNLLVVADVSPLQTTGGSARVVKEQALGLSALGHSVQVLCRRPSGDLLPAGTMNGVTLRQYPVSRAHPLSYASSSIFGARAHFRDHFAEGDWDVVLFNQPFSAVGVQSVLPSSVPSIYCFYSPAGTEYRLRAADPGNGSTPVGTMLVSGVLRRLERMALGASDRIVVLSDFSRGLLLESHGELDAPTVAIPGGVDLVHFQPASNRAALRDQLRLPRNCLILLTIRDLEQRMGIDTLLRALRQLPAEPTFQCLIGGSGPLRGFLEKLAADLGLAERVRFLGFIPEEELPLYYQAADLFVLPTRCHEGFGLVTVEALACGTPVVATPAGATPEILGPLDPRLLASDVGETALAETLMRVLPFTGQEGFRRACRAYVENNYSWRRHVQRLEGELHLVTARRPRDSARES